jgi:tetratricopeptide (TPR) repeat protein
VTEEREFLLQSLRDLDAERAAGDITTEDYVTLRDDYTARAADALRGDGPAPQQRRRPAPWLAVAGIAALAIVAGVLVARTSGQRLPSDALTGNIESSTADRLVRARQLIIDGKALDAIKTYDAVLKNDPDNPEALAYRGWLLRLAGRPDDGLRYVERAIAADAAYPDAHFFRAMILWKDKKDAAGALPEFRAFLAAGPPEEQAASVRDALAQAEAEAAAQPR